MNDLSSIEEQFRHLNPVPNESDPPMNTETGAATLLDLDKRTVTQSTTTRPTWMDGKQSILIAARAATIVILVGAGLFAVFTSARDNIDVSDNDQSRVYATSIDDIAGRWRGSAFPWYIELAPDGTHSYGVDELRLEENLAGRPDGTYQFEGSLVYIESSDCKIRGIDQPGVYRVRLLAPDEIQFEPVTEACEDRRTKFAVDDDTFEPVTWSRVEN